MYGALWRVLPGPIWAKILILAALVALVLFVCVEWIFPYVDSLLNSNDQGTVGTT